MTPQNRPQGHDKFTVWDSDRNNAFHFDSRPDAEERMDKARDVGVDPDLFPPGESPDALYGRDDVDSPEETDETDDQAHADTDDKADQDTVDAELVDHSPDANHEPEYSLENRTVAEDPLDWVPGDFVDEIDGTLAINRKGFEVLGHFYDVDVTSDVVVAPEDTDHEYCRVEAVAITPDGRRCEAHGSAHVDRGDDHYLLLEMADTRARKRALSIATGVGAVAVEELQNEVRA